MKVVDLGKQPRINILQSAIEFYSLLAMKNRLEDRGCRESGYQFADRKSVV
jgi:hypothetical protein